MKDLPQKVNTAKMPNKKCPVNVFPVLVTPNDLIDSDDEQEKENLKQKAKREGGKDVRPSCTFGSSCYRKNPVHKSEEAHPGDDDYKDPDDDDCEDDERPECEFGTKCYRKNPSHRDPITYGWILWSQ